MNVNIMNRPGTIINWIDQSTVDNVIEENIVRPLYLQLITSDKGPEDLRIVQGNEFFNLYGSTPSFKKHGQPLIQAAGIIKAGGELLCKRVVAEDAMLGNLVVVAKVSNEKVQKVDTEGKPLYIDATTGTETTDAANGTNEKVMINTAKIKYDAVSIKGAKTLNEVKTYAEKLVKDKLDTEEFTGYDNVTKVGDPLTDENPVGQVNDTEDSDANKFIYPLFVVTDNGRGLSTKRFRIVPDYTVSKSAGFQLYKLMYIGETPQETEYVWFNFYEDRIYLNKNISLDMIGKELVQLKASSINESINLFVKRLSTITGIAESELFNIDAIFGCNRKGEQLAQITIDTEGYNLQNPLGMMLQEGDNGAFGDQPFTAPTYGQEMAKVINGELDDSIFDRDKYMIDVCCDANYPIEVKKALYDLANYREDFIYLRDFGVGQTTFEAVLSYYYELPKSKFVADYCQSWDIVDPWTKKQIQVTATYSMALKMVNNLVDKRSAPLCGILHGFVFSDIVEGSVSAIPKVTPNVDQKEILNDLHINYASFVSGAMTMETSYTSIDGVMTQLGFSNNILAVTKVIHDIRTECPKIRYSFITDEDLEYYREEVNKVIRRSANNFAYISMEYVQDEVMKANKIFEANIFVRFKNFEQTEIFNIYTLNTNN